MTSGTVFALSGRFDAGTFMIGVPLGLLTTAILWINEFPDAPSDQASGKNHLVVTLGKKNARYGFALLLVGAFAVLLLLTERGIYPRTALWALGSLPLALHATSTLFRHYERRELASANRSTVLLQLLFGVLLTAALIAG
jgi:1,4-dihydroxy-2-naphthoate octaprenyltransferase